MRDRERKRRFGRRDVHRLCLVTVRGLARRPDEGFICGSVMDASDAESTR